MLLDKAAASGYSEYEGSMFGESPDQFMNYLNSTGLRYVATGLRLNHDEDIIRHELDRIAERRIPHVVTYWPWFTSAPFTLDNCKESVQTLNRIGEMASERGLTYSWHSHDKEFSPLTDGTLPFDYLMQYTDSKHVKLELDIYWITKGGQDPVGLMKKYPGRTSMMHVKDMDEDGSIACPGMGVIDFTPIFQEAMRQGVRHYFVERDNAANGIKCLQKAKNYLDRLKF